MDGPRREQLLDIQIDANTKVRDASGVVFATWCLSKVNGLKFFDSGVQKITALSQSYPGKQMEDDDKIDYIETLIKLGAIQL